MQLTENIRSQHRLLDTPSGGVKAPSLRRGVAILLLAMAVAGLCAVARALGGRSFSSDIEVGAKRRTDALLHPQHVFHVSGSLESWS